MSEIKLTDQGYVSMVVHLNTQLRKGELNWDKYEEEKIDAHKRFIERRRRTEKNETRFE